MSACGSHPMTGPALSHLSVSTRAVWYDLRRHILPLSARWKSNQNESSVYTSRTHINLSPPNPPPGLLCKPASERSLHHHGNVKSCLRLMKNGRTRLFMSCSQQGPIFVGQVPRTEHTDSRQEWLLLDAVGLILQSHCDPLDSACGRNRHLLQR
jgi:hypothetical protein